MTHIEGIRVAPEGVTVLNPAFDVTPGNLITAFITERGVLQPPFLADNKTEITTFEVAETRTETPLELTGATR